MEDPQIYVVPLSVEYLEHKQPQITHTEIDWLLTVICPIHPQSIIHLRFHKCPIQATRQSESTLS